MPTYDYRCPHCGGFELRRSFAEADTPAGCPDCGTAARRVYRAPALQGLDPAVRRALDAGAASADSPRVTGRVPGRSAKAMPVTTDPRHARLPRP